MTITITHLQLLAFRSQRQHLAPDAQGRTPEDVFAILKTLQPFPPIAGTMPGSAPHPRSRIEGYDETWAQQWRAAGRLVKGRFMSGNIAYVTDDDFTLYAAAFRRPLRQPISGPAQLILHLLEENGSLPKAVLQELSGLNRRHLTGTLLSLNRAFEIMEIQREIDWDSPWDLRRRAYPDLDVDAWEGGDAQAEVLLRFTRAFGPATVREMADWSGWNGRTVRQRLDSLLTSNDVVPIEIEGQAEPTYLASDGVDALETSAPLTQFVVVLPPNDPFVLPQWSWVKAQYGPHPLPYCYAVIVVDGKISGAAWGPYKRRYIPIEELRLNPALLQDLARMDELLSALESHVGTPIHIHGINGEIEALELCETLERNGYVWDGECYVKSNRD